MPAGSISRSLSLSRDLLCDHQLDLRVEPGIVGVAQPEERLADDGLEDLPLRVGRLAGVGERLLELEQVLRHLGRGEQLEAGRIDDLDLIAQLAPSGLFLRTMTAYSASCRSAFASALAIDARSL